MSKPNRFCVGVVTLLAISTAPLAHAQTTATIDFSSAYIKSSGTGVNKVLIDGLRIPGDSNLYELEYIVSPGWSYALNLGPGSRFNQSTLSSIESQIRNKTFAGTYTVNNLSFQTSLVVKIAQDGFVAGEVAHIGNAASGVYRGRVAGYIKPVIEKTLPPTPCPTVPRQPPSTGGPVLTISALTALDSSLAPCDVVRLPSSEGTTTTTAVSEVSLVNVQADVNTDLSAVAAGSVIKSWTLYLKRLDTLQYANGTSNQWSANREYNLSLTTDGKTITGSVSIPQEIVGGTQTNPQTGNITLSRQ